MVRPWFAVEDEKVLTPDETQWPTNGGDGATEMALAVPTASAHAVTAATAAAAHREGQALAPESPKRQATLLLVAGLLVVLGVAMVAWAFLTQH